jgi:hypothetical protein
MLLLDVKWRVDIERGCGQIYGKAVPNGRRNRKGGFLLGKFFEAIWR